MNNDPDKFAISFSDVKMLFQRSRKTILIWMLSLGILGALFALTRPTRYESDGFLRERASRVDGLGSNSILQVFGGMTNGSGDSEAISIMKSRTLLKPVIKHYHLQAQIEAVDSREGLKKRIFNNLTILKSKFFSSAKPLLKDPSCSLKIEELTYDGEIAHAWNIELKSNGNLKIVDQHDSTKTLATGQLNQPIQIEDVEVVFSHPEPQLQDSRQFTFLLDSLPNTVKRVAANLIIEPSQENKSLLKITYSDRDRHLCGQIVNTIMEAFQDYLKYHHSNVAQRQLEYLNNRREKQILNLKNLMEDHAAYLTENIGETGSIDTKTEMDFLVKNQQLYKQKLLEIELEIKLLKNINFDESINHNLQFTNAKNNQEINLLLLELRDLKQERDSLEIKLQKRSFSQVQSLHESFDNQVKELNEIQLILSQIRELRKTKNISEISNFPLLINNNYFLLKEWKDRIENAEKNELIDLAQIQANFQFYLINLERLFEIHEHLITEKLTHQQNNSDEYSGISINTAHELYCEYSKDAVHLESKIRQNLFFIEQLKDENFEITSLSLSLDDSVSKEMISQARELVLSLRDSSNQSAREQQRIKEELSLQRTFLSLHLEQIIRLNQLDKDLFEEKMYQLQASSLSLTYQKIALLEKNLKEYVQSTLFSLNQEKELINQQLEAIRVELTSLPNKWVSEQLIKEQVDSNKLIVREIVKLVESKNISHNVEIIQTAPLDLALSAFHPKTPPVFLWGFIGMFLGGLIGSFRAFSRVVKEGLPVSINNLQEMGAHVSGYLHDPLTTSEGQLTHKNLDTLRYLQTYLNSNSTSANLNNKELFLLVEGNGPNYAPYLADLFIAQGLRVLTFNINSDLSKQNLSAGLFDYLKKDIMSLPIQKGSHGDWVDAGKVDTYGIEMLASSNFIQLRHELEKQYDVMLIVTTNTALSSATQKLLSLFPVAALTLKDEKVEQVVKWIQNNSENSSRKLTLLMSHHDAN